MISCSTAIRGGGGHAGFVVDSQPLAVAGAMVGAAGLILTQVMCDAEPFTGFRAVGEPRSNHRWRRQQEYTNITSCSAGVRPALEAAERVVIVPGRGLRRNRTPSERTRRWRAGRRCLCHSPGGRTHARA